MRLNSDSQVICGTFRRIDEEAVLAFKRGTGVIRPDEFDQSDDLGGDSDEYGPNVLYFQGHYIESLSWYL